MRVTTSFPITPAIERALDDCITAGLRDRTAAALLVTAIAEEASGSADYAPSVRMATLPRLALLQARTMADQSDPSACPDLLLVAERLVPALLKDDAAA